MIAHNGKIMVPEAALQRQAHRPVPLLQKSYGNDKNNGSDNKTRIEFHEQDENIEQVLSHKSYMPRDTKVIKNAKEEYGHLQQVMRRHKAQYHGSVAT